MEFPAGLVDDNETAAEAAIRELKEECGYVCKVLHVSPIVHVDAGMSSACMRYALPLTASLLILLPCMPPCLLTSLSRSYVTVSVDLDHPDNQNPVSALEGTCAARYPDATPLSLQLWSRLGVYRGRERALRIPAQCAGCQGKARVGYRRKALQVSGLWS